MSLCLDERLDPFANNHNKVQFYQPFNQRLRCHVKNHPGVPKQNPYQIMRCHLKIYYEVHIIHPRQPLK